MNKLELKHHNPFIKDAKLSFQVFSNLELKNDNLEFMQLLSSAVLSGSFENICFYNASFLSTKFQNVNFNECNLKSTDICSIWAKNCYFRNVNFSDATISDSTFVECIFDNSLFESVSLTKCQFVNCTFEQFPMDDSTFSLNSFTHCNIKNTCFTESFYYQIFDDCTFENVNMNAVLLGFNFGFSQKVFSQLTEGVNLIEADKDFKDKGLYINAAIFRINQVQKYYDEAMIACVSALGEMIQQDILIKADEIEFLKNLTSYLQERKQIAPISILRIWKLLSNYSINNSSNIAIEKALSHTREYSNMLYFSFIDFQKNLQNSLIPQSKISNTFAMAELKIIYIKEPTLPLLNYLIDFSLSANPNCPEPNLVRTEKGSFHEYHEIAVTIIPYLQTFFGLLGVVVPIIIYQRQNHDDEKNKGASTTEESKEIEITLTTTETNSITPILSNTNIITPQTNTITSDVIKILESHPVTQNAGFCGYNSQNIHSITIHIH